MSEQSPETPQTDEPEVEGHVKNMRTEDPSVLAGPEERNEEEGAEVEGHAFLREPEDPSMKG